MLKSLKLDGGAEVLQLNLSDNEGSLFVRVEDGCVVSIHLTMFTDNYVFEKMPLLTDIKYVKK